MNRKLAIGLVIAALILGPTLLDNLNSAYADFLSLIRAPDVVSRVLTLVTAAGLAFSAFANAEWLRRKEQSRLATRYDMAADHWVGIAMGAFMSTALPLLALLTLLYFSDWARLTLHHPSVIPALRCVSLAILAGLIVLAQAIAILVYIDWFTAWQMRLDRFIADQPRTFLRRVTKAVSLASAVLLLLSVRLGAEFRAKDIHQVNATSAVSGFTMRCCPVISTISTKHDAVIASDADFPYPVGR